METKLNRMLKVRQRQTRGLTRRGLLGGVGALAAGGGLLSSCSSGTAKGGEAIARDLRREVAGPVFARGDAGYEAHRSALWVANVSDRYPAATVVARSSADVARTVRYAARSGVGVAIRGGGHNWSGASLRDDRIMIDLGQLRSLDVDAEARLARSTPGISGGHFFNAIRQEGLAFPVAHCPSVPMSGFVLNGGFGWNSNSWGTAASLTRGMELVTADGDILRASDTENAELFWAARGSGPGFFAAVTGFEFELVDLPGAVLATNYVFPLSAAEAAAEWANSLRNEAAPDVEYTYLVAASGGNPADPGICVVSGIAFSPDEESARRSLAYMAECPIVDRALMVEREVPTSWEQLFEAVAALFPPKLRYLGNTIWTDAPITEMYPGYAEMLRQPSSPHNFSNCVFYPVGRGGPELPDAAVSMQRGVLCLYYAIWEDAARDAENLAWFRRADAIFNRSAEGHYIGETDLNLYPAYAERAYGKEAWGRIEEIRRTNDPAGVFPSYLGQPNGDAA